MKYLYIDRDLLERRQPCVAIRHEDGEVEIVEEVVGFGWYRMRAPHGEPLTPDGPAAWVEARAILTRRHVRVAIAWACVAFWGVVAWAIGRWV